MKVSSRIIFMKKSESTNSNLNSAQIEQKILDEFDFERPERIFVTCIEICMLSGIEQTKGHAAKVGIVLSKMGEIKKRTSEFRLVSFPAYRKAKEGQIDQECVVES